MPRKKKVTARALVKTLILCAVLSLIVTAIMGIAIGDSDDYSLGLGDLAFFYIVFFGLFVVPIILYSFVAGRVAENTKHGLMNVGFLEDPDAKTCPQCAEDVKGAAKVCRYCGHRFEP